MMAEICGTTPLASVLRRKMSAYAPRLTTPSWMRAPPESLRPITGAPFFMAWSRILQIFSACASESEPPINLAIAGDDAIAGNLLVGEAEVGGAMGGEHVQFLKSARVEQQIEPLTRGEFALFVLRLDTFLAATQQRLFAQLMQFFELLACRLH